MAIYPELKGKNAIVTGGNTGIGEAIARDLAGNGVNVMVVGAKNREGAERVVAALRDKGVNAAYALADLTRGDEVNRMVEESRRALGPVDILVNCAGGFPARRKVIETSEEEWDHVIALNLKSAFLCAKAVLPDMLARKWGRIVNIGSEAGRTNVTDLAAHYSAGKAGLMGLTRHLAREVAREGITVNCTNPATTWSARIRRTLNPDTIQAFAEKVPLGRLAEPEEQAAVVTFLCSNGASYITGAAIDVTGGKVMF